GRGALRRETAEQHDAGDDRGDERGEQRAADHRATAEAGLLVRVGERLDGGGTGRVATARGVAVLDVLLVAHDRLGPVDGPDAESEQRESDAEPDVEVVGADAGDLAVL